MPAPPPAAAAAADVLDLDYYAAADAVITTGELIDAYGAGAADTIDRARLGEQSTLSYGSTVGAVTPIKLGRRFTALRARWRPNASFTDLAATAGAGPTLLSHLRAVYSPDREYVTATSFAGSAAQLGVYALDGAYTDSPDVAAAWAILERIPTIVDFATRLQTALRNSIGAVAADPPARARYTPAFSQLPGAYPLPWLVYTRSTAPTAVHPDYIVYDGATHCVHVAEFKTRHYATDAELRAGAVPDHLERHWRQTLVQALAVWLWIRNTATRDAKPSVWAHLVVASAAVGSGSGTSVAIRVRMDALCARRVMFVVLLEHWSVDRARARRLHSIRSAHAGDTVRPRPGRLPGIYVPQLRRAVSQPFARLLLSIYSAAIAAKRADVAHAPYCTHSLVAAFWPGLSRGRQHTVVADAAMLQGRLRAAVQLCLLLPPPAAVIAG